MRLRIHHALFTGFLGIVGLLVVLIYLLVGSGLRRELNATFEAEIGRQLALSEDIVSSSSGVDPDDLARRITERIQYRVTFIDLEGWVLGDSYVDPGRLPEVENHADRPEFIGVVDGGALTSFAERTSATVGEPLLYGATLTTLDGEPMVLRIAAPQTDIVSAVGRVQQTVGTTGMVATLFALIAALGLTVAFARPLIVLSDRARRLSEGHFTTPGPPARVAELRDVDVAFTHLTEQLRARLDELGSERDQMAALIDTMGEGVIALTPEGRVLRTNQTVETMLGLSESSEPAPIDDVFQNAELRALLHASLAGEAQSAELVIDDRHYLVGSRGLDQGGSVTTMLDMTEVRRLEAVRTDFVANASHELKTPLTSIRGFAETLVDDEPPPDLRREFLTSIRDNTLRLQRLVDDLLDLSRLESGGWQARLESVHVHEVIAEAWDLIVEGGGKERRFSIAGGARASGDRQGLLQVFRNLFANAVRHTEENGSIEVSITETDQTVMITVRDDGEGIPAEVLERVFERFFRADSSRARDFGGTGLGLAIVKHLVTQMGGDVSAESEVGVGTTISISLPTA